MVGKRPGTGDLIIGIGLLTVPAVLSLIVLPILLVQSTPVASMFIDDTSPVYVYGAMDGGGGAGALVIEPRAREALDIALRDPRVSSIISGVEWRLRVAVPAPVDGGVSLVLGLVEPVFVDYEMEQWYNPLGPVRLIGWVSQLAVDVDLVGGRVASIMPLGPDYGEVPPASVFIAKIGGLGDKVLRGAEMLEAFEEFSSVGVEARPFWVMDFVFTKRAYYYILDGGGGLVGVGCIDLNLMLIDKTCTGRVEYLDIGSNGNVGEEHWLVEAIREAMYEWGSG